MSPSYQQPAFLHRCKTNCLGNCVTKKRKGFRWVNQTYVYSCFLEFRPSSLTTFVGHLTHFGLRGLDNPSRPRPCCTLACRGRGPTQGTCRRELTAEGHLPSMHVSHPMLCMFGVQAELPHDGKAGTFVGHLTLLHVCIAGSTPSRVGGHQLRYCYYCIVANS